ncbi:Uncharacterised protein [Bordetella pertussis]|nr:Uncharacterised protein [Bordetella pertussis]
MGEGAVEDDLAGGHRTGAQLVLEPRDAVAIASAVFQQARDDEHAKAARSRRGAFRTRQHQHVIGVDGAVEPFLAIYLPCAPVEPGMGADPGEVGAAGALCHEMANFQQGTHILAEHAGHALLECVVGVTLDHADRRIVAIDGAQQAELRLREQVGQRVLDQWRRVARPAEHAGLVADRGHAELAERDPLHFPVCRVVVDAVDVAAVAVARRQRRRMLVRGVRQFVQRVAGQLAEPVEVRREMAQLFGIGAKRQQLAQRWIEAPEVLAPAVVRNRFGRVRGAGP